jgi:hypothetical protein
MRSLPLGRDDFLTDTKVRGRCLQAARFVRWSLRAGDNQPAGEEEPGPRKSPAWERHGHSE